MSRVYPCLRCAKSILFKISLLEMLTHFGEQYEGPLGYSYLFPNSIEGDDFGDEVSQ